MRLKSRRFILFSSRLLAFCSCLAISLSMPAAHAAVTQLIMSDAGGNFQCFYDADSVMVCAPWTWNGSPSGLQEANYIFHCGDVNCGNPGVASGVRGRYDFCWDGTKYLFEAEGCTAANYGTGSARQQYLIQGACNQNHSSPSSPPDVYNSNNGMTSSGSAGFCWCRAIDGYGNVSPWVLRQFDSTDNGFYSSSCLSGAGGCHNACANIITGRSAYADAWAVQTMRNGTLGALRNFTTGAGLQFMPHQASLLACEVPFLQSVQHAAGIGPLQCQRQYASCTSDCILNTTQSVSCGVVVNGANIGIQTCNALKNNTAGCYTWGAADNCSIICNAGYGATDAGTCSKLCSAGFGTLRSSTGLSIPLYDTKNTSPAIHIRSSGGQMCYGSLGAGSSSNALNVRVSGTNYHAIK